MLLILILGLARHRVECITCRILRSSISIVTETNCWLQYSVHGKLILTINRFGYGMWIHCGGWSLSNSTEQTNYYDSKRSANLLISHTMFEGSKKLKNPPTNQNIFEKWKHCSHRTMLKWSSSLHLKVYPGLALIIHTVPRSSDNYINKPVPNTDTLRRWKDSCSGLRYLYQIRCLRTDIVQKFNRSSTDILGLPSPLCLRVAGLLQES